MSKRIFKYRMNVVQQQVCTIPSMYPDKPCTLKEQLLHIEAQANAPCLWVMVDDQGCNQSHTIVIKETGKPCDDVELDQFLGTCLVYSGHEVFHLFLIPEEVTQDETLA